MATTCPRHPDEETRLACSNCGTPICHRCAVQSAVGQKCPDCSRQSRGARARGKPRQYVKATGLGLAAAIAAAVVLVFVIAGIGYFYVIGSGLAGYGVARAVSWGAEGNRTASPFRLMAYGLAFASVQLAWLLLYLFVSPGYGLFPTGFSLLAYVAAVYGASFVFRW